MIIEFTGIPGSGKSTVLKELAKIFREEKRYIFDIQKYFLGFKTPFFIFDFYLFSKFFILNNKDKEILKLSFNIIMKSNNSFFHKINILRNVYKRLIVFRLVEKEKNRVFFIDEGIYHIPFTLFVDGKSNSIDEKKARNFFEMLDEIDNLIVVDVSDDVILDRVIKRGQKGHRRINFNNEEEIKNFIKQSRKILEIIKELNINKKIYINDKKINNDELLNLIGENNV